MASVVTPVVYQQQQQHQQQQFVVPSGGLVTQQGQPQYVMVVQPGVPNNTPRIWSNYNAAHSTGLGWTQLTCGLASIVFASVGIWATQELNRYNTNFTFIIGAGIWCAVFYIIAGGFGIGAGKHKTTCMIVANMVMSIFACVFVLVQLGISAASVGIDASATEPCWGFGSYSYSYSYRDAACWIRTSEYKQKHDVSLAMGSLLLFVGVVEFIAAIWSSAICCAAVCCGRRVQPPETTVLQTIPAGIQPVNPGSQFQTTQGYNTGLPGYQ